MTRTITFFYEETGLEPTIRIRDLSDNSLVVEDEVMSEVGDGFYKYVFSGYTDNVEYAIRADGGSALGPARYQYAVNEVPTAHETWSRVIDGSIDATEAIRVILAAVGGQAVRTGNTVEYKRRDGTTTQLTVTVDTNQNRIGSTITGE